MPGVFWIDHPAFEAGRLATSLAPPGFTRLPVHVAGWRNVAAGVLTEAGVAVEDAWQVVAEARGVRVPETAEQGAWLHRLFRAD